MCPTHADTVWYTVVTESYGAALLHLTANFIKGLCFIYLTHKHTQFSVSVPHGTYCQVVMCDCGDLGSVKSIETIILCAILCWNAPLFTVVSSSSLFCHCINWVSMALKYIQIADDYQQL